MGEASRRLRRFSELHPFCCFCGGGSVTSTIDHVPPKVAFIDKHIPTKFNIEFPACESCNQGSRQLDQAAALLSLTKPNYDSETARRYTDRIFRGVANNADSIIEEIYTGFAGNRFLSREFSEKLGTTVHATNFGDQTRKTLHAFAAKLGMAYFYKITGIVLPSSGAVVVDVLTNADLIDEDNSPRYDWIDAPFIDASESCKHKNQFLFRSRITPDGAAGALQMGFHRNLLCIALVVREAERHPIDPRSEQTFFPGFLGKLNPPLQSFWTTASFTIFQ